MTADPLEPDDGYDEQQGYDDALIVDVPALPSDTRDTTNDTIPFRMGDDDTVLIGTRPKTALLMRLVRGMSDESNELAQLAAFNDFIDAVLSPESRVYVLERLEDPDDDLDIDSPMLARTIDTLVGLWYQGPTGGRGASSRTPQRTSRRSTARRPSRG